MKLKSLLLVCLIFSIVLTTASAAAKIPDQQNNPIDKNFFNLLNTYQSTAEQRLIATSYITAWQDELVHAADENAAQELQYLEDKANLAFDEELSKWGNGTGGPGAAMIAQAQVYRERALAMIGAKERYEYSFFAHTPDAAYVPLLTALLNSQIYHYDAFARMPDAYTANMTLYQIITQGTLPKLKDKLKLPNGAYALNFGTAAFSPEKLYDDIFYGGIYSSPDNVLSRMVTKTPTGLLIEPQALRYEAEALVFGGNHVADQYILHIFLARVDRQTNDRTFLGQADVILQTSVPTSCGLTIAAYQPSYENFSDVSPFVYGQ